MDCNVSIVIIHAIILVKISVTSVAYLVMDVVISKSHEHLMVDVKIILETIDNFIVYDMAFIFAVDYVKRLIPGTVVFTICFFYVIPVPVPDAIALVNDDSVIRINVFVNNFNVGGAVIVLRKDYVYHLNHNGGHICAYVICNIMDVSWVKNDYKVQTSWTF